MTTIDFAERKAEELFKFGIESREILNRTAQMTFAFLATALSAVFAYFLKLYKPELPVSQQNWHTLAPVLLLTLYLGVVAAYLVIAAMMPSDVQPPGNKPEALIGDDAQPYSIDDMRKAEMFGLSGRAETNRQRNRKTGRVISRVQLAIVGAPLVFVIAWALA